MTASKSGKSRLSPCAHRTSTICAATPFEKAKLGSNTYEDWYIDRAFLLGPMQVVASKFLMTLKDYPPSQAPGDWSLKSLEEQIKHMTVGGK